MELGYGNQMAGEAAIKRGLDVGDILSRQGLYYFRSHTMQMHTGQETAIDIASQGTATHNSKNQNT